MKRLLVFSASLLALTLATQTVRADIWETDFEKARAQAAAGNKYMLLDFTGSDWCGWCIKLNKEVFSKEDFKTYAKANLVCVELDFPSKKKISQKLKTQNEKLAKQYKVRGYPTVLILSPKGELVDQTGYREGGPEKYIEHLKGIIEEHKKAEAAKAPPAAEKKP
ncbi:MAG: thioredoxin family protein [Kiritimatiellia bacterium]